MVSNRFNEFVDEVSNRNESPKERIKGVSQKDKRLSSCVCLCCVMLLRLQLWTGWMEMMGQCKGVRGCVSCSCEDPPF
jgi:hypothetical protein